jgi:MFS family permease
VATFVEVAGGPRRHGAVTFARPPYAPATLSGPPSPPARHDPYLALRNANYRAFLGGFLPASTGLQMLATALGWEVWDRTHDKLLLGYLGLARAIPVVLLVLPAGHLADLRNRRRILIATQTSFALLCALLALVSGASAPLWLLFALVVATGCTRSFHGPARNALLPLLVTNDELQNAATWNSGAFQFAAVVGPLLAGGMIDLCGAAWPVYGATAGLCAFAALQATRLRPREQASGGGRFTLAAMTAGAEHLWREKTVLAAIALDLFAVLLGGATALLPVYQEQLGVGAVGLGAMKAAPDVGALLVAVVLAHRPPFRRAGPALLLNVAGFGAATIAFGLSTSFPLSLLLLALLGGFDNVSVVIRSVLVQIRTPDQLRGRVGAVNSLFIECSNELGAFESGLVAWLFDSAVVSVVSGGIGTIAVVLGIAWRWPEIRRLGRIEPPAG